MKTNTLINYLVFGLISMSPLALKAHEGSGVRGGGVTVNVEGRPRLRDLVDKTTCRRSRLSSLVSSNQDTYSKIIKSLQKTHWYLASAYETEKEELKLCLTKNLVKLSVDDEDSVFIARNKDQKQVAIRLNDTVFLDEDLYNKLPSEDKAFLVLHEITHSFIPLNVETRNDKVRSIVRGIYENYKSPLDHEDFELYITENDLVFPANTLEIDANEKDIKTLLNGQVKVATRLAAFHKVGYQKLYENLYYGDWDKFTILISPLYDKAFAALGALEEEELIKAMNVGLKSNVKIGDSSLLDLANKHGNSRMINILMNYQIKTPQSESDSADVLMKRMIVGDVSSANIENEILDQIDVNAKVEGKYLLEWAVQYNRWNLVENFSTRPELRRNTILKVLGTLIEKNSKESNLLVKRFLVLGKFSVDEAQGAQVSFTKLTVQKNNLELFEEFIQFESDLNRRELHDRGIIHEIVKLEESAGLSFLKVFLSSPKVDVNLQDSFGKTALDLTLEHQKLSMATLLAAHPSYKVSLGENSTAVEKYNRALVMLNVMVDLGSAKAIEDLLNLQKLNWFDLMKARDMASLKGFTDCAKIITQAMER